MAKAGNLDGASLGRLFRTTDRMLRRYHEVNHPHPLQGLDPEQGQGRVLALLQSAVKMTQRDMCNALGVRQQSLGETLSKLEKAGLVERERAEGDRRIMEVELTEAGKSYELPSLYPDAFSCLTDEEKEQMAGFLKRIIADLEERIGPDE